MAQLEDIYNIYFKDVFLYIYRLSGDQHLAEDITAETFMKALKSLDSFKGNCDIRVWLCQIAKNDYFSYLRKKKNAVNIEAIPGQAADYDVEKIVASKETSMNLHEIIHHLDEPYKEVFSLRVFGELTFKQIAKLFGKSDNWACVTYHRARNKIKERMEDYR